MITTSIKNNRDSLKKDAEYLIKNARSIRIDIYTDKNSKKHGLVMIELNFAYEADLGKTLEKLSELKKNHNWGSLIERD